MIRKEDLPVPLTREGCELIWQMHQDTCPCGEPLVQWCNNCHPNAGLIVYYEHGTGLVHICCKLCERPVCYFAVAEESTPEQRALFKKPRPLHPPTT